MVVSSSIPDTIAESSSFDQEYGGSKGISSKRFDNGSKGILSELLRRMNPSVCLGACSGEGSLASSMRCSATGSGLRSVVPDIMAAIDVFENEENSSYSSLSSRIEKRTAALKQLYELSGEKENRVPLVCTQKYNVIPILAKCLAWNIDDTNFDHLDNDDIRRMACLTLNQLSLPFQNKKVMVFGNGSNALMENLKQVIHLRLPETYLCCICLMNITYLGTAVDPILNVKTPTPDRVSVNNNTPIRSRSVSKRPNNIDPKDWNKFPSAVKMPASRAPSPLKAFHTRGSSQSTLHLDDTKSLLRSIESLIQDYRPFLQSKVLSVEGEAIRWSIGLLRNLTKKEVHCSIIARTDIPFLIISLLVASPHPLIRWSKDSVEVMSLTVLKNMACHESTKSLLKTCNAIEVIQRLDVERERLGLSLNTAAIIAALE